MKHIATIVIFLLALISVGHLNGSKKIKMENVGQVYRYKYPIESYVEFQKYRDNDRVVGTASGFVFHKDQYKNNYILTNHHVCYDQHGDEIKQRVMSISGESSDFFIMKVDEAQDLCVVMSIGTDLPPIKIASKESRHGDRIFIMGSPAGYHIEQYGGSIPIISGIYNGKVSWKKAKFFRHAQYYTARILPGSSGSAVLNEDNEVVGVIHSMNLRVPFICYGAQLDDIREITKSYRALK